MNLKLFLFSLLVSMQFTIASDLVATVNDTVYYRFENGFLNKCEKDNAEGFSVKMVPNKKIHQKKIYYLQSKNLMAEYSAFDKLINQKGESQFSHEVKSGKYSEFYLNGQLRIETNYDENKLDGVFNAYHENGQLSHSEIYKNGEWKNGKSFDEFGKEIDYFLYREQAEFNGNKSEMFHFFAKNFNYPESAKEKGQQGKTVVKFKVEIDGTISNIVFVQSFAKSVNDEMIRVIKAMPKWKPAKFKGISVASEIIFPFVLRLD